MTNEMRGKIAIAGLGYAGLGSSPGWTAMELMARATKVALEDAGLTIGDIDGLCCSTFYHFFPSLTAAEYLGIQPKWSNSDMVGGSSFQSYVLQAAAAISAGLCSTVLVAYGSNARSSRNIAGLLETPLFDRMVQAPLPITGYALAAARHMHLYGTTRRQLAEVAVAARQWAMLNPDAPPLPSLDIEEVVAAPTIADPLSKFDCCLVSDGGGALILTSTERARDLKQPLAAVLGGGTAHWHREISQMPDLTVTAATESGRRAYEMAGVMPADVDVVQLYDAFTINPILFLEDLGFCEKGEGGRFVEGGRIGPGGSLPVNTNGGGLSFVHPGMYGLFALAEAVIQIRGQGTTRQVDGVDIALSHGNGGTLSHQATTILGSESSL
ncbi:acetyl-CoA acetyltransferase [Aminobacter aminovorans]|uniref:Acetyl-CoA acetyltransferase n=1 Tax=Aminobacter aminovorans TaxID=83263 RepID=A0AAC9AU03_AMIAI|nr:acetyl-CoA acetyltransferase [Aminobacter aminovorans]AMS45493.1 Thiolase [Aminobacter aminovorans]MBB3708701.1 acetyl-CoA acetyltransferase [Aminobacter aminovorans]